MKAALKILNKAQELIRDPEHWTQGWYARDSDGTSIEPTDPEAVCFCTLGALRKVVGDPDADIYYKTVDYLDRAAGEDIAEFNDRHTHAELMDIFERAKELANVSAV